MCQCYDGQPGRRELERPGQWIRRECLCAGYVADRFAVRRRGRLCHGPIIGVLHGSHGPHPSLHRQFDGRHLFEYHGHDAGNGHQWNGHCLFNLVGRGDRLRRYLVRPDGKWSSRDPIICGIAATVDRGHSVFGLQRQRRVPLFTRRDHPARQFILHDCTQLFDYWKPQWNCPRRGFFTRWSRGNTRIRTFLQQISQLMVWQ